MNLECDYIFIMKNMYFANYKNNDLKILKCQWNDSEQLIPLICQKSNFLKTLLKKTVMVWTYISIDGE